MKASTSASDRLTAVFLFLRSISRAEMVKGFVLTGIGLKTGLVGRIFKMFVGSIVHYDRFSMVIAHSVCEISSKVERIN